MSGKKLGDSKPRIDKCDCPVWARKNGGPLVNHTYACLLARRGDRTLEEYYG